MVPGAFQLPLVDAARPFACLRAVGENRRTRLGEVVARCLLRQQEAEAVAGAALVAAAMPSARLRLLGWLMLSLELRSGLFDQPAHIVERHRAQALWPVIEVL